jgi:energy-coupling factor transport system substrate-specific component
MFAVKMALSSLPNINLNALILILVTVFFGWKALYTVCVYVLLEGLMFGFGVWWVSYLIVWPLLVVLAMAVRKTASPLLWAVFAGLFGLAFGPMMYVIFFTVTGGWEGFLPMWIAGIPYDLVHAVSNFLTVLILFRPLEKVFSRFV